MEISDYKGIIKHTDQVMQTFPIQKNADTLLVALSGGADSICLLHLLQYLGYQLVAAHVNYQLRGEASVGDEIFCRQKCADLNIPLHVLVTDTFKNQKNKLTSIQKEARKIRYQFFESIKAQSQSAFIVTAHHSDDSIETFFINLVRGTGLKGLSGIPRSRNDVIRPILSISKNTILGFLEKNNITFRHDESNDEVKYLRNKIRHQVIPELRNIKPEFDHVMASNMSKIKEANKLNIYFTNQWSEANCHIENGVIHIDKIKLAETGQPMLLYHLLKSFGFNYAMCQQIFQDLARQVGKMYFSKKYCLLIDRDYLLVKDIQPAINNDIDFEISKINSAVKTTFGHLSVLSIQNKEIELNKNQMLVSENKVRGILSLRKWRFGDRFQPEGMGGQHKKISDLLTDLKFSKFEKDSVLVLSKNDEIIWVLGLRRDHRYAKKGCIKDKKYLLLEWLSEV